MTYKTLFILLTLFAFPASANRIQKKQTVGPTRKLAQAGTPSSSSFETVNIHYNVQTGSPKVLQNVSLNLTPFGNYISFDTSGPRPGAKGKSIQMDCRVSKDFTKWNCLSACEGGELTIAFHQNLSFEQIRIAPFKIKDRACDGQESESDRIIHSAKPIVFQIDKMRMAQ